MNLTLTKNYLVSFTGGYSLNLADTISNIDEKAFPPDIKNMAQDALKDDGPKTLIDIHKAKYGKINQMKSLDEVKKVYPEFKDVLSDSEIEYNANSFIDDVKNEKLEWFDSDVDLSLQLLQMYWADGFSLSDLKEYTGGKNISSAFEKLNIPRFDRTYAKVLKLSDKEYNERFAAKMSERLTGIERKKAERRDGVYIPRGPLTEEHKKKISEGLIKHYSENPEKLTEMSNRMKEYYINHPEEKEKLHNVLVTAWGLRGAKPIRKKLSKFMGKKDIEAKDFAELAMNNENNNRLKEFWNKNKWAKEQWSKCMAKAWEIEKAKIAEKNNDVTKNEEANIDCIVEIYPPELKNDMKKWFIKNGYDLNKFTDINFQMAVTLGDKPLPEMNNYVHNAISAYFEQEENVNLRADMLQITVFKTLADIGKNKKINQFQSTVIKQLKTALLHKNCMPKVLSTEEIFKIYEYIVINCYAKGDNQLAELFQNNLEYSYSILKNKDNQAMLNIMSSVINTMNLQ